MVAELACDASIARADELARRWAIALILARPLDGIGEIPLEDLAREAPSLCEQALRAMQSDGELERLTGRGASTGRERSAAARRLAAVCGARGPAALVEAVEALRGVLWEALLDQLTEPSARLIGDMGDRLAYVCAAMLAAAVETIAPATVARAHEGVAESDPHAPAAHEHARVSSPSGDAVIVDERAPRGEASPPLPSRTGERALPWNEPPSMPPGAPAAEIEIRDERHEEGPAAWISSIGAQLEQFERDGMPFAVLLVELVDIERARRQESPEELSRLAGGLERALADALGSWSGSLARERPGRCWLLAPETDRAGAELLARQLMRELSAGAGDRGAPLAVAIGTATCPEDGREPAALAAHADVGLYAARSAVRASVGRSAAPVDESA